MAVQVKFHDGGLDGVTLTGEDTSRRGNVLLILRGMQWVAVASFERDARWHILSPAPGAGSAWRVYAIEELSRSPAIVGGAPAHRAETGLSPLQWRLFAGATLAVALASLLQNGRPDYAIAELLINPGGLVVLGVILLAAAAWPRWWPRVTRLVRGWLFEGS